MSLTTVSRNPFKNYFVRNLMRELDADDEAIRREKATKGIPPWTFGMDLAFVLLTTFTVISAIYFSVGVTGYGWYHSLKAIMEINHLVETSYTMFIDNRFPLELCSMVLLADCAWIIFGALISTSAIYESAKYRLIWGYGIMVGGIPVEIVIIVLAFLYTGRGCYSEPFEARLQILLEESAFGNKTKTGLEAVEKFNSLQFSIVCCGINSYKDFVGISPVIREPPSSCCKPAWAQNVFCSTEILEIGNEELIEDRLNEVGCVEAANALCERVVYTYTYFLLLLVLIRTPIAILQGYLVVRQLKSYRKTIGGGLFKPLDMHNRSEMIHSEGEEPLDRKPSRISKSILSKRGLSGVEGGSSHGYLRVLQRKGRGIAFEKEIAAIAKRKSEAMIRRRHEEELKERLSLLESETMQKASGGKSKKKGSTSTLGSRGSKSKSIKVKRRSIRKRREGSKVEGEDETTDIGREKSVHHPPPHPSKHRKKGRRLKVERSQVLARTLLTKSDYEFFEKGRHPEDVAHQFVGGTEGARLLSIKTELDIPAPPPDWIDDEDERGRRGRKNKKATQHKKRNKGKKGSLERGASIDSRRSDAKLPKEKHARKESKKDGIRKREVSFEQPSLHPKQASKTSKGKVEGGMEKKKKKKRHSKRRHSKKRSHSLPDYVNDEWNQFW